MWWLGTPMYIEPLLQHPCFDLIAAPCASPAVPRAAPWRLVCRMQGLWLGRGRLGAAADSRRDVRSASVLLAFADPATRFGLRGPNAPHNRARERHSGNGKKFAARAPVDAVVRPTGCTANPQPDYSKPVRFYAPALTPPVACGSFWFTPPVTCAALFILRLTWV
jgi:hypothetical protein